MSSSPATSIHGTLVSSEREKAFKARAVALGLLIDPAQAEVTKLGGEWARQTSEYSGDMADRMDHIQIRVRSFDAIAEAKAAVDSIKFAVSWLQGLATREVFGPNGKLSREIVPAGRCISCLDEIPLERIMECDPHCIPFCVKPACQTNRRNRERERIQKHLGH